MAANRGRAPGRVLVVAVAFALLGLAYGVNFESAAALGNAFALGAAAHLDGTLLVGADDDYDDVTDVPITRFRSESA